MSVQNEAFGQSPGRAFIESSRGVADDPAARGFETSVITVRLTPGGFTSSGISRTDAFVRLTISPGTGKWRDTTDTPPLDGTLKQQIFDIFTGALPGVPGTFETIIGAYSATDKETAVVRQGDEVLDIQFFKGGTFDPNQPEGVVAAALPANAFTPSQAGIVPDPPGFSIFQGITTILQGTFTERYIGVLNPGTPPPIFIAGDHNPPGVLLDCPGVGCTGGGAPFSRQFDYLTILTLQGGVIPSTNRFRSTSTQWHWMLSGRTSASLGEQCCMTPTDPLVQLFAPSGYVHPRLVGIGGYEVWLYSDGANGSQFGEFLSESAVGQLPNVTVFRRYTVRLDLTQPF